MPDVFVTDLIQTPTTAADFKNNVQYARVVVARQLGLSSVAGTPEQYAQLSQAEQVKLVDELSVFIVGNPQLFSARQLEIAQRRVGSTSFRTPLADDSFTAAAGEFVVAFAADAEKRLMFLLGLALVAGLAFLILPGSIAKVVATSK